MQPWRKRESVRGQGSGEKTSGALTALRRRNVEVSYAAVRGGVFIPRLCAHSYQSAIGDDSQHAGVLIAVIGAIAPSHLETAQECVAFILRLRTQRLKCCRQARSQTDDCEAHAGKVAG